MMKKIFILSLLIIFTMSMFLVPLYIYSHSFDYDNESSILMFDDKRYSKKLIEKLEEEIPFSNMYVDYPFWKFNLEYKPKCIRKTPVGYYAVLIHEDKSFCFVFWRFK